MQRGSPNVASGPDPSTANPSCGGTSVVSSCDARPSNAHVRSESCSSQHSSLPPSELGSHSTSPYAYQYMGFKDPISAAPLPPGSRPLSPTPLSSRPQNQPSRRSSPLCDGSGAYHCRGDPTSSPSGHSSSPSQPLNLASRPATQSNQGGSLQHVLSGQDPQGDLNHPSGDPDLDAEYFELMQRNLSLNAELSMLKIAFQSLVNTVPLLLNNVNPPLPKHPPPFLLPTLPTVPVPAPLQEKDYPLVKFWRRSSWEEHPYPLTRGISGKESASQEDTMNLSPSINTTMRYMEDEYGQPIDSYRSKAIRQIAHRIFRQLAELGVNPKMWSVAGRSVVHHFNHEMALQVPEMRYCANHWKAGYLAMQLYPLWHELHTERLRTRLRPADDASQWAGKRSRDDINNTWPTSKKRVKVRG